MHKYIAEAHRLNAQIAMAKGELDAAEAELKAALQELHDYPAPLVAWRAYADLGRLHAKRGDQVAAQSSFTDAVTIINSCAANVTDEGLRETFLTSSVVREVTAGAFNRGADE